MNLPKPAVERTSSILEMETRCRVGILYRARRILRSIPIQKGGHPSEMGQHLLEEYDGVSDENREKVEAWIEEAWIEGHQPLFKEDKSYMEYFYRTLQEGGKYYYVYEHGVGWKCGSTHTDTPLAGRMVPIADAIEMTNQE